MGIHDVPLLENGLRLLARSDLGGWPNGGEGMSVKVGPGGERHLFVAHENPPAGFCVLDVSDPRAPRVVFQEMAPGPQIRTNSLAVFGDVMLLAMQAKTRGAEPAGVRIYDVSDPTIPRVISFFDMSGPSSRGPHFVSTMDGEYAHLSTGAPDFEPKNPKDDQFYMVVDIRQPARPREVGRWWLPGQRLEDTEDLVRHPQPQFDAGYRVHHALSYPDRPDRAYLGYIDGGVVILDISERSTPRMVSRLDYHPPMPGFTHTVVPLFERNLLVISDEASGAHGDDGYDWPKRVWIADVSDERHPLIISTAPEPEGFADLHRVGGRIGAHNIHENEPLPGSARLVNTVVATWFSAGIRVYDIRDPFRPLEIAAFLPATPPGQRGSRINDVFVDERGIVYAVDRASGGLYILEYTGDHPLD